MTDKHRRFLGPVVEMRKLHDSAEQRIVHSAEMLDRKSLASVGDTTGERLTALQTETKAHTPEELAAGKRYEQLDLFGDDGAQSYGSDSTSEKDGEHDIQRALLDVKRKFGRNAVIKAMDMEDGATGQDRNRQIGGHRA